MSNYIPKLATIAETCEWLTAETGEQWSLPRLLEVALQPWAWLDYSPEHPAIFGDRYEGFLAPFVFVGDAFRLEADRESALMTMTRTPDDKLLRITPGLRIALDELRFKREDVTQLAAGLRNLGPAAPSETAAAPLEKAREADKAGTGHDWKEAARAIASEYLTKHKAMDLHPSLNDASEHVAREMRTAKIYGPQGKPLSHGTIKREALQGDWWKRNG